MELTRPDVQGLEGVRTPALVIDLDRVDRNISATLGLVGGKTDKWRPHLKTSKLGLVMRQLVARGVTQAKCSTTLELQTASEAGFTDLLLAYPIMGAQVDVVKRVAAANPNVSVSVLVEDAAMLEAWRGSGIGIFIDLNGGMDRTGMLLDGQDNVLALVRTIHAAGLRYAGLHYYDGHAAYFEPHEAERRVHGGYERLLQLVGVLAEHGCKTPEVITAGTPAFPYAVGYQGFTRAGVLHRVSPGTVVYNDRKSLTQLPESAGYDAAAFVLSSVVSHPSPNRFCCDAGHKSVSADAGDPTCEVVGAPQYMPRHPSEEHLPVDVPAGSPLPSRGEILWLVPSHVCPTVNNFDHALVVRDGKVTGVERVTARGRHPPIG